jgi:large subunit ribosomal protein L31
VKTGIHPEYVESTVTCSCGNTFQTRATVAELHVELCNECHPFFTGKQKLVDSGGRVERFRRRYANAGVDTDLSKQGSTPEGEDEATEDTEA